MLTIELRVLVYYHCLPLLKSLFFPNKFQHGSGGAPAVLIMDGLITHHGYVNLQGGSTPGKNVCFIIHHAIRKCPCWLHEPAALNGKQTFLHNFYQIGDMTGTLATGGVLGATGLQIAPSEANA